MFSANGTPISVGKFNPKHQKTMSAAPEQQTLPPFPTWPPPSGGAPFPGTELGPITNPYPYGSPQPANISIANPAPLPNATFFPDEMEPSVGQNQKQSLPAWPWPSSNVNLPDKAPPSISAISPTPPPAPAAQPGPHKVVVLNPPVFPAGSYIDGYGHVITPTVVVDPVGSR